MPPYKKLPELFQPTTVLRACYRPRWEACPSLPGRALLIEGLGATLLGRSKNYPEARKRGSAGSIEDAATAFRSKPAPCLMSEECVYGVDANHENCVCDHQEQELHLVTGASVVELWED